VKRQDEFRDVQTLAEFANLNKESLDPLDRQNFENFRNNYPEFVPQGWWDYQPTGSERKPLGNKQWELNQEMLREAWKGQFAVGMFDLLRTIESARIDPKWATPVTSATGYVFAAIFYFTFCYMMARYARYTEARLAKSDRR